MKRMHVHVKFQTSTTPSAFIRRVCTKPVMVKDDYAKWMLDDPRMNFAISTRGREPGLDHLGIQVESEGELQNSVGRLREAGGDILDEGKTTCCYAKSEKSWIDDPAGIPWETFFTKGESIHYGDSVEKGARVAQPKRAAYLRLRPPPHLAAPVESDQPTAYSSDLKVRCRTPSGASASLRMAPHVCL